MMEEKELIAKLREFRQIRPSRDWVVLTKSQILGQEPTYGGRVFVSFFQVWKPALATVTALGILFGVFTSVKNSLPGDFLYPIKRIAEKTQAVFVSEEERPQASLELAGKRLEELTKIAKTNQVKNLAPAINEFQASVSEAAKKIVEAEKPDVREIGQQTKKLEENKQKVEALGVVLGEAEELDNALALLVEMEIEYLENRTLTEKQEEILSQMKELVEEEKYSEALELWLTNQ